MRSKPRGMFFKLPAGETALKQTDERTNCPTEMKGAHDNISYVHYVTIQSQLSPLIHQLSPLTDQLTVIQNKESADLFLCFLLVFIVYSGKKHKR